MRVRTYGLILLAAVGIAPLGAFGALAVRRSHRTAVSEVRQGNRRLAHSIAKRIAAFIGKEHNRLADIGAGAMLAPNATAAQAVLDAYSLNYLHIHNLVLFRNDRSRYVGRSHVRLADRPLVAAALAGRFAHSNVRPAPKDASGAFSHTITFATPVVVAGKREGAIIGIVDLVGIWPPINAVKVGRTGFARLLSFKGVLLAHGNPEERRFVFDGKDEQDSGLVAGALLGHVVDNQEGTPVVASVAFVPGIDWMVVVEQAVAEAFGPAMAMERALFILGAIALAVAALLGLVFGRAMVRPLERLRAHTRVLGGGDLDARVDTSTRLVEVRALADSLDEMSSSLKKLQDEARERERLTTFSRVAAGLAHDLRQPIEAVRAACDVIAKNPDDPGALAVVEAVTARDLPRLSRYMDDLNRLARTGDLRLDLERSNPAELAQTVVKSLASLPKWRGVEFVATGRAKQIDVDPHLVRRAITNLASNAADACLASGPGGRVSVEVSDVEDEDAVEFRVCDTGVGIEPERLGELFQADFRSTKRSTGVGLGLGVVRQVAESHGGKLNVTSTVGKGSVFALTLPRSPGAGQSAGSDAGAGSGAVSGGVAGAVQGKGSTHGEQEPKVQVG